MACGNDDINLRKLHGWQQILLNVWLNVTVWQWQVLGHKLVEKDRFSVICRTTCLMSTWTAVQAVLHVKFCKCINFICYQLFGNKTHQRQNFLVCCSVCSVKNHFDHRLKWVLHEEIHRSKQASSCSDIITSWRHLGFISIPPFPPILTSSLIPIGMFVCVGQVLGRKLVEKDRFSVICRTTCLMSTWTAVQAVLHVKFRKCINFICYQLFGNKTHQRPNFLVCCSVCSVKQSFNSTLVTSTENSITTHKSICEQMVLWMHLDKRYVSLNELLRLITFPRTSSVF